VVRQLLVQALVRELGVLFRKHQLVRPMIIAILKDEAYLYEAAKITN